MRRDPFVGLRPFDIDEGEIFFGRERDVAVLKNLVLSLPIVVVYAMSGTGKSSLLTAGLIPALAEDPSSPVVYVKDRTADIPLEVHRRLGLPDPVAPPLSLQGTLVQYAEANEGRPVVVIDQFEERIRGHADLLELWDGLGEVANSGLDTGCVVISIREDYLAELSELFKRVPGLMDASFRVPDLSEAAFVQAVLGPLEAVGSNVTAPDSLVEEVLEDLRKEARRSDFAPGRIEPGYFQIVWSYLWSLPRTHSSSVMSLEDYRAAGRASGIVARFVEGRLSLLLPLEAEALHASLRYLVLPTGAKVALTIEDLTGLLRREDFIFVGRSGHRRFSAEADGMVWFEDHLAATLSSLFQRLTQSGAPLLRRVARGDRVEFELVHDLLGPILLGWRRSFEQSQDRFYESVVSAASILASKTRRLINQRPPRGAVNFINSIRDDVASLKSATPFSRPGDLETLLERRHQVETMLARAVAAIEYAVDLAVPTLRSGSLDKDRDRPLFEARNDLRRVRSDTARELTMQALAAAAQTRNEDTKRFLQETAMRLRYIAGQDYIGAVREEEEEEERAPLSVRTARLAVAWLIGSVLSAGGAALCWALYEWVFRVPPIEYFLLSAGTVGALFSWLYAVRYLVLRAPSSPGSSMASALRRVMFPRGSPNPGHPRRGGAGIRQLGAWWPIPIAIQLGGALGGAFVFESAGWSPTAGFNFLALLSFAGAVVLMFTSDDH